MAKGVAWPTALLGPLPSQADVELAHKVSKAGTKVAAAWCLYARGCTDKQAAMAAGLLCGATSTGQRNRLDQHAALGRVTVTDMGHGVRRLTLGKGKPVTKPATAKPANGKAATSKRTSASKQADQPATTLIKAADMAASKPSAS